MKSDGIIMGLIILLGILALGAGEDSLQAVLNVRFLFSVAVGIVTTFVLNMIWR